MAVQTRTAKEVGRVFPQLDIVVPAVYGATLTAGQVVYQAASVKWLAADANAGSGVEEARGVVLHNGRDGEAHDILLFGWLSGYNLGSLAAQALLYLSDTPGEIENVTSATNEVRVGRVYRLSDAPDYTRVALFNFLPFWRGSTLAG